MDRRGRLRGVNPYSKLLFEARNQAAVRLGVDLNEVARRAGSADNNSLGALISSGKLDLDKAVELAKLAGWGPAQLEELVWQGVCHKNMKKRESRAATQILIELVDRATPEDRVTYRRRIVELALTDSPGRPSTPSTAPRTGRRR